jgi:ABC-2 type transport system permease protein
MLGMVRKADANPWFPGNTGIVLIALAIVLLAIAALRESRVLGIAAAAAFAATLVLTFFSARDMGEWGPVLTGYVGLLMLGAVFIAIGLLASGLTSNQIIAWVATAAVLLMLTVLISWLTQRVPPSAPELPASAGFRDYLFFAWGWIVYVGGQVLQALDLQEYLNNFAQGILDLRDFVLYLSLIVVALYFTVRSLATTRAA